MRINIAFYFLGRYDGLYFNSRLHEAVIGPLGNDTLDGNPLVFIPVLRTVIVAVQAKRRQVMNAAEHEIPGQGKLFSLPFFFVIRYEADSIDIISFIGRQVFPAPKNPDTINTGMFILSLESLYFFHSIAHMKGKHKLFAFIKRS